MIPRVVLDTNVLVAGLRSRLGACHRLLRLVGAGRFRPVLSVPLLFEYEEVLRRRSTGLRLAIGEVDAVVDYLCATGDHQPIHFLWRPRLPDPRDDLVLEVAVNGQCDTIVTFNGRDFVGSERFGIAAITPAAFLTRLGATR
ncbi:MAG: putative toxin-antitoxin system toxin component, PIN family [Gemmatimonadota bacterium]